MRRRRERLAALFGDRPRCRVGFGPQGPEIRDLIPEPLDLRVLGLVDSRQDFDRFDGSEHRLDLTGVEALAFGALVRRRLP